tara:strand:+ start:2514 stop:3128 length:615 start_codon:yes stop_codon:yes gene_type:complete
MKNFTEDFIYLKQIAPTILQDIKYATCDNFTGKIVDGYINQVGIIREEVAIQLKKIQNQLKKYNISLKVFDLYRPKRACMFFKEWAESEDIPKQKKKYYPFINKNKLFGNYIKALSVHSLGYAIDITLVDKESNLELDMGTIFDYFGEKSHVNSINISPKAQQNRKLLQNIMTDNGFNTIPFEWWHFNYASTNSSKVYHNFPVS